MATNKISVLLIKEQIDNVAEIIKDGCTSEQIGVGTFYYKHSFTHQPKWVEKFFGNQLHGGEHLKSSSVQGVLIIQRDYMDGSRFFAICFGYGRNLINPDAIEERFGLITTLNSVDDKSIRSIDINSLEAIPKSNRIQSSKLSDIPNFNIDVEKDLLRAVTGKCQIESLGKNISGSDPLCISTEVDVDSVGDVLDVCYEQYKLEKYKEHFAWIDQIARIKSSHLIGQLNNELIDRLNNGNIDKIWMSIPEIIDWQNFHELKLSSRGDSVDDIDITTVLSEVYNNQIENIERLKSKTAKVYDSDDRIIFKWSYFKCLYAEIELNAEQYILNNGQWYHVNTDFVQSINAYYDNVEISNIDLIDYTHKNEGEYNIAAAKESDNFLCMDKKLVSSGVTGNDIEFCDIYTLNKQMIHIKQYGGSSVLSHLFNQGLVSGTLLVNKNFRQRVNAKLLNRWKLPVDEKIDTSNYEIIFGIISKYQDERPHIPFFSKITLKNVATTLQNYGYKVSLKRILDTKQNDNN